MATDDPQQPPNPPAAHTASLEDIDRQQERLQTERDRLAGLLIQEAKLGSAWAPPAVASGIREARASIARIKKTLGDWGVNIADHPDDTTDPQLLLAVFPPASVPEPIALPPGSRMTLSRNPHFVGRVDELRALAAALAAGTAAATGLGGIGKSNLAVEFLHRYGQYFAGGVFWLSFADPAGIDVQVADCGGPGALDLPSFSALTPDDQVARVRQEWQRPTPRLLVFDNCEDEALLEAWRPATGGCRILVTSRRPRWSRALGVTVIALGVLARDQSVALLRRHRPDLAADNADLSAIAAALGNLPLALHLAGSYLEVYADDPTLGDPAAFLEELHDARLLAHPALQGENITHSPTNHQLHVGKTFALSYDALRPADPVDADALALLACAACLAPNVPIPRSLLLATLRLAKGDRAAARQAAQSLERLVALGLLETAADHALRLHGLLATFVQQTAADADALGIVEQALITMTYNLLEDKLPAALVPLQAHIRHLAESATSRADTRASNLCTVMARYLRMIGSYAAALPYAQRALVINEVELKRDESTIATDLSDVASLLQDQGDYAAARPLFERALAIAEQSLGPTHPTTGTRLNNLALLLKAQGEYVAARPLFERALAIAEQSLGPTHPTTGTRLNNLALLLKAQGEYAAARPLFERALAIAEQSQGPAHPETGTSLNNLALLLQAQGEYAAARPLFERALQIAEQSQGPAHPATATRLNNLAGLLRDQGEYTTARPLYERALAIAEQTQGPTHPETGTRLNNLALLLQDLGDYAAARPLFERALAIAEQSLGSTHPTTGIRLNNLALLLQDLGDYIAARPLYERALAIAEQSQGPTHPETGIRLNNLANLLQDQGEYAAARPLYERALAIAEQSQGPTHPDTAIRLNNLAGLLQAQGDYATARPLFERALQIVMLRLGAEHPTTQTIRTNLAALDAPAPSAAQQIADITAQFEAAVAAALADLSSDRAALLQQLEDRARWVEEGEKDGSPFLALAAHLRALAVQLKQPGAAGQSPAESTG